MLAGTHVVLVLALVTAIRYEALRDVTAPYSMGTGKIWTLGLC